jgi:hypothetical protein
VTSWIALRRCCTLAVVVVCLSIPALHDAAAQEHLYPHAERLSGPWGYIDKTGRIVIPLRFEAAEPFSEELAAVRLGQKFGFIDRNGRVVIEPRFDAVRSFRSGRASVKIGNDWGFIDAKGSEIVKPSYVTAWFFSGGYAQVSVKGVGMGTVNLQGQVVIPPEFALIEPFSERLAVAQRERRGKYGYIDTDGKVVIPFQFERAFAFRNGRALVLRDTSGRSGFIDKEGAFVLSLDHKIVYEFSEGLAVFADKSGRFGVIDAQGQIVIPPRFTNVGPLEQEMDSRKAYVFSEGLLPVSEGKGFGYIDRHGTYVIQPQFLYASAFRDGLAVVRVGYPAAQTHLAGLIDRTGKFIVPPVYDWVSPMPGGLVRLGFGKRLGYVDAAGRPLTFTTKDMEGYVATKLEQLKPPPPPAPGRAVVGKAGDVEYYLRLPESLCALDDKHPADRIFIDDHWTRAAKSLEAVKWGAAGKQLPKNFEQTAKEDLDFARRQSRFILGCERLQALREGGDWHAVRTYAIAMGMQKDRHDASSGAGMALGSALLCGTRPGDVFEWSEGKDRDPGGIVEAAFQQLRTGQNVVLRAKASDLPACYTAAIMPSQEKGGPSPDSPAATLRSFSMLFLADWLIQVTTVDAPVSSPGDFLREFKRDSALLRRIFEANRNK